MRSHKWFPRLTLSATAVLLVGACAGVGDRPAPAADEPARDIALAPEKDTATAVFEDTGAPPATVPEPEPVKPLVRTEAQPRPVERTAPPEPESVRDTAAETPAPAAEPEPPRVMNVDVPAGTLIHVALDEELSTRKSFQGDAFTATIAEPLLDANGRVLVPQGARVRGRVTHVQNSSRVGETAVLNIAFEALIIDDVSYPLEATVVEANPERVSRQSTGEQVGKVAAGAAAGAIIGRVLGGRNRDAVKGAVIGAAAGTAIALGTADVDAVLKAGSAMIIRVDRAVPIVVPVE